MFTIRVPKAMVDLFAEGWHAEDDMGTGVRGARRLAGLERALEGLEPEAKRELASDLLRSASRAEGYEG